MNLVDVRNLCLDFATPERTVRALDGVSLTVAPAETVCLVGESGSGKSVLALSLARLLAEPPARYVGGEILVGGRDLLKMKPDAWRSVRGGVVSYIFQDPTASLNPVMRVGDQIAEALRVRSRRASAASEIVTWMKRVGIGDAESRMRDYPHQLSGGMQQRIMIAMAVATRPQLLVADEPTTALDVTIQAQIFDLLRDLQRQFGMAILLITHNLGLVREMGDRVSVMYAGQIVETASAAALLRHPRHPYTRALMESVPEMGRDAARLPAIPGSAPRLGAWPPGCRFHPRCPLARDACRTDEPPLLPAGAGREARCPVTLSEP